MNSFVRSLKLALRYRWTLVGSVLCALAVAVLWGGNIGAVYPLVEVSLKGETLHDWSAKQAVHYRERAAHDEAELAALGPDADASVRRTLAAHRDAQLSLQSTFEWLDANVVVPSGVAFNFRARDPR
jgi:ATP-binding cassette subfamily B protein/subfamily B ATP-binding cassette protein MsbA